MKMMKLIKSTFFLASLCLSSSALADTPMLITDTHPDRVEITAQFTGQELLLFGAMSHAGDIVVKLTSPDEMVDLQRKIELGVFWLTGGKMTVHHTPGIYYLLSSAPLEKILGREVREKHGLVLDASLKQAKVDQEVSSMSDWREAFLRLKKNQGFYLEDDHGVALQEERLFVSHIKLPANLPQGSYKLNIYLVNDGKIIATQQRDFQMSEVRLEGWISNAAYNKPWMFGIGFTVLALFGGLALGIILRRDSDR